MIGHLPYLPAPPPDGADLPCQWGDLTTSGPALEWPRDEWRHAVHQYGVDCDRPAAELVTYACPLLWDEEAQQHTWRCPDHPEDPSAINAVVHATFTVCWFHMTYSRPTWVGSNAHLHDLRSEHLVFLGAHRDDWREWVDMQNARHQAARDDEPAETVVFEPTLF